MTFKLKRSQTVPEGYQINQEEVGGTSLPWDPAVQHVKDWWKGTGIGDWWEDNVMEAPDPSGGWFQPGKAPVSQGAQQDAPTAPVDPLAGANIPTMETVNNIMQSPAVMSQAQQAASSVSTPDMLGNMLQSMPGIGVSSTGEWVDWNAVSNYLIAEGLVQMYKTVSDETMQATGRTQKSAQSTSEDTVPGGGAHQPPVNPTDSTQLAPAPYGEQPSLPEMSEGDQYMNTPDSTAFLMEQISKQPDWVQMLVDGLDVNILQTVKDAVEPFRAGLNINPDEVDWQGLTNEVLTLAGISGFDTGSVSVADFSGEELEPTKNLKAFIGYARRQASKYGIKGSRLEAVYISIRNHLPQIYA